MCSQTHGQAQEPVASNGSAKTQMAAKYYQPYEEHSGNCYSVERQKSILRSEDCQQNGGDDSRGGSQQGAMRHTITAYLTHPIWAVAFPAKREQHAGREIQVGINTGERRREHDEIHDRPSKRHMCGGECGDERTPRKTRRFDALVP